MRGKIRGVAAAACLARAAMVALVICAPASAGDAGACACAGSLIDSRPANWDGNKVGELDVHYDATTGKNCAKLNHAGATWGRPVRAAVQVSVCQSAVQGTAAIPSRLPTPRTSACTATTPGLRSRSGRPAVVASS